MDKKKIVLLSLFAITFFVGIVYVSAARNNPNQPWRTHARTGIINLGMFVTNTDTDPIPVSIEGNATIDGNGEGSPEPETKHVERILDYPMGSIQEIINLEGYKDLQISWVFDIEYDSEDIEGGALSLYWVSEEEYQVGDGEVFLTGNKYPDGNWGTKSTKVQSNYLKIHIANDVVHEGDKIRLILYATK